MEACNPVLEKPERRAHLTYAPFFDLTGECALDVFVAAGQPSIDPKLATDYPLEHAKIYFTPKGSVEKDKDGVGVLSLIFEAFAERLTAKYGAWPGRQKVLVIMDGPKVHQDEDLFRRMQVHRGVYIHLLHPN